MDGAQSPAAHSIDTEGRRRVPLQVLTGVLVGWRFVEPGGGYRRQRSDPEPAIVLCAAGREAVNVQSVGRALDQPIDCTRWIEVDGVPGSPPERVRN